MARYGGFYIAIDDSSHLWWSPRDPQTGNPTNWQTSNPSSLVYSSDLNDLLSNQVKLVDANSANKPVVVGAGSGNALLVHENVVGLQTAYLVKTVAGSIVFKRYTRTKTADWGAWASTVGGTGAKNFARFSAMPADVIDSIPNAEIGFYNGSDQQQNVGIDRADKIYIPNAAATFGQDASKPVTPLGSATDQSSLLGSLINSGGFAFLTFNKLGSKDTAYCIAKTIATHQGGFALNNLIWFNPHNITATAVSFNVTIGRTHSVLTDSIADKAKLVFKTDLEGHENDVWFSFDNDILNPSATDNRGVFCFTSDTAGDPLNANVLGLPNTIADDTDLTLIISFNARANANQNDFVTKELTVADYEVWGCSLSKLTTPI